MSSSSNSIWSPLRLPTFRGLWAGSAVYFTGNAMQVMAASWLMVERTGSSFLAALVQTAVFLPMFLLALPAGVLADTSDRRTLIVRSLGVQVGVLVLLSLLALLGWAGPAVLLAFTFAAGCCTALLSPAWNTSVADTVPRADMPQAITAMSIAWNSARALGPSIAGFIFAALGAGWVFVVAVLSAVAMLLVVRRWPPAAHAKSPLPAERLWSGTLAGLRYARHSPIILAQLLRTVAYSGAGSALWALLPAIAAQHLQLGAAGFGFLMGCLGTGAVATGLVLGKLRARLGLERLVAIGCLVFAAVMLVSAFVRIPTVVFVALAIGGAAWMAVMATFNTATQSSAPPWVRSRAVALHTVSALGSFAIGSAFWGAVSGVAGVPAALSVAALAMTAGIFLARAFPLRMGDAQDVTPGVGLFEDVFATEQPLPDDGPVSVEVGYRIRAGEAEEFLQAVSRLRASRRRDGATFWRVYRDLADPSRYVERFIVASWADYLHQRARATLADQELEAAVREFLRDGEAVTTQHYIAER
ncbi:MULTISPECIES: MFS transporter [Ramlibacter]|uniref:MFS transporter n=1 Tax=Ramlibacter pinisoli TaxID=2682844 RepID=A0A6N8IYP0_9BURK|nr:MULTISPECIES: MFS transporter [Ramlibacter]MBA2961132.1 MFS transporter [Ramlibacter sp. CGMCC 1.13660]MVQ31076.1 MFS transporter [Ramlibacter pinisoli]